MRVLPLQGRERTLLVFHIDITERKRMEGALKESEEKFRSLIERTGDIVWTTDLDFRTTYVSPSIEKVLGFTPKERKQQTLEEMLTPESIRNIQAMMQKELEVESQSTKDPDRSITIELKYYHKNGSTVWLENNVTATRDSGGVLIGVCGVSRDITERKRVEEALTFPLA